MTLPFLVAAVALAAAALLWYLRYRFRLPMPVIEGTAELSGLHEPVEVIRDRWGVPHIYASRLEDLLFAQGFVQAQDRLWQMELNRRMASGRLSEIFGRRSFEADRFVRTVGIPRAAAGDLACLSERSRTLLRAYLGGVNAYLEANPRKLPLEFALLGFQPEPWKALDCLAWIKMQAWQLSANWSSEILNAALIGKVGPERAARLFGGYPPDNPLILADQEVIQAAGRALEAFRSYRSWYPVEAGGSNSWAVRGGRSRTGGALFAYDPHLGLAAPSLWHACHLVCPELEATGATFPGVPGIIVGHNRDIAFGFTTSFADVQDLYLERFVQGDPLTYEWKGRHVKAERIVEEIRVKGEREPRKVEVILTRHGPLIGGLPRIQMETGRLRLALRWAGHEGSDPIAALLSANRAANWADFRAAMSLWGTPSQNALYADRRGNIGYQLTGRIPVRRAGIGLVPVPGWNGEQEWEGWIAWEQMPREYNPRRGYLVSANNQVVGREYPHYIGLGTLNGNRAARIEGLIEAREELSLEQFAAMQVDLYSAPAKRFAALLGSLAGGILEQPELASMRGRAVVALGLLKGWEGELSPDSAAAAIYGVCEFYAKRRLFEPWLGELTGYYCNGDSVAFASLSHHANYCHLVLLDVLEQDDGAWMSTPQGRRRSREQLLAEALRDALLYLSAQGGKDPRKWRYGSFHRARFFHPLGTRPFFGRIFNPRPVPYGGSPDTIWQAPAFSLPSRKRGSYSAGWRQLIDLSDWDEGLWIHAGGQSGHPASAHYGDLIPPWAAGRYHGMLWSRSRVEAQAAGRLLLRPLTGGAGTP